MRRVLTGRAASGQYAASAVHWWVEMSEGGSASESPAAGGAAADSELDGAPQPAVPAVGMPESPLPTMEDMRTLMAEKMSQVEVRLAEAMQRLREGDDTRRAKAAETEQQLEEALAVIAAQAERARHSGYQVQMQSGADARVAASLVGEAAAGSELGGAPQPAVPAVGTPGSPPPTIEDMRTLMAEEMSQMEVRLAAGMQQMRERDDARQATATETGQRLEEARAFMAPAELAQRARAGEIGRGMRPVQMHDRGAARARAAAAAG